MGCALTRSRVYERQAGFAGGLNTNADPVNVNPNQLTVAQNAIIGYPGGEVLKRTGSQRMHATAIGSTYGVQGLLYADTLETVIAVGSNWHVYTSSAFQPFVWTDLGQLPGMSPYSPIATSQASLVEFTDANGPAIYISTIGVQGLFYKYTLGVGITQLTAAPPARKLSVQNQRLFAVDGQTNTLYWSSLNNGDDLGIQTAPGDGGSDVINTFGESQLFCLQPLGNGLLIAHANGISVFTGYTQTDIAIASGTAGVSAETGTRWADSMCSVETVAFLASSKGIFAITSGGLSRISDPIDTVYQNLAQVSVSHTPIGLTVHDPVYKSVYFVISDYTTVTTTIYAYNYALQAWSGPWTGSTPPWTVNTNAVTTMRTTFGSIPYALVLLGGSDGYVRQIAIPGSYLDDVHSDGSSGTAYTMIATTRPLYGAGGINVIAQANAAGNPISTKAWRFMYVQGRYATGAAVSTTPIYVLSDRTVTGPTVSLTIPGTETPGAAPQRRQLGTTSQYLMAQINDTAAAGPNPISAVAVEGIDYSNRFTVLPLLPLSKPVGALVGHAMLVRAFAGGAARLADAVRMVLHISVANGSVPLRMLVVPAGGALDHTGAALAVAATVAVAVVAVLWRVRVTTRTRIGTYIQSAAQPASGVLAHGNGLQVCGITARAIATQMVDLVFGRHRTHQREIHSTVCRHATAPERGESIAGLRDIPRPAPASIWVRRRIREKIAEDRHPRNLILHGV